ncbi:MAG: hypothetical protein COV73_02225 [Candidatus Omnitrophica bacterium CG11_big_fil_rev_8_21_14_0_20_43_6]|nr:MAG: hypothetical protein COV73_02225 [Candidatus Omnitrophica bacterium CG11_big_fil_rev_8_21_14_0_20_43_6]
MKDLRLPLKFSREIDAFIRSLKAIYQTDLVSVILYGSAASGEFITAHSNLNILVILKSTQLAVLKLASGAVKKFKHLTPLFLTQEYIRSSTDIFPIEFLDLKENYTLLEGMDVLKEIQVDPKNLRFQCEQELRAKLLNLRQLYLKLNHRPAQLQELLFESFNPILHVLRNVLRLKGVRPPYQKEKLLKELAVHLKIDCAHLENILAAKLKKIKLKKVEIEGLFSVLVDNLDKITQDVDAL